MRLFRLCCFHNATIFKATHVFIVNTDKRTSINKLQIDILKNIFFVNRYLKYIYYSNSHSVRAIEYNFEEFAERDILE